MINTSEHKNEDIVKSGVVDYPIGFPFYFNPDRTPQLLVKIGDEELRFNHNFELSEDKGSVVLRPTEEESWTLEGPEDFSWMAKWDGKDLLIERAVPFVQDSDYQLGRISSEQIERDFDLSVMRDQALDSKIKKLRKDVVDEFIATDSRFDSVQELKADKAELSNYLPLTGGTLLGKVLFDIGGTAGKNTALIGVKTESGMTPLIGASTDDNGALRDIAVIPKLQSGTFKAQQIDSSFIGTPSNPVTRIHAKKIGTGLVGDLLIIPDGPGTIARLADIPDTYTKEELDAKFAEIPDSADTYSKAEIDAKLSSVYKFKGSVANVDALPADAVVGDTYNVEDTGANYAWDGSNWDKLSDTINLSDYATVDYADELYVDLSEALAAEKVKRASEDKQLYDNLLVLRDMLNEKDENDEFIQLTTEAQTAIPAINELNEKKASREDIDAIGGDGTAGQVLTKTDDGMAWQDAAGGGASLPDQTDNAGKFLITDGTDVSWGASYAKSVDNYKQVNIGDIDAAFDDAARTSAYVAIGAKSCGGWTVCILGESPYSSNTCIGSNSTTNFTSKAVVIGYSAKSDGGLFDVGQIAIGAYAKTGAKCAIQLGGGASSKGYTNSDANTFKVGNANGNFEMMSADGTIPADRMSATAGTTGQVLTKTDTGMAWADASGGDGDIDCGVMS